MKGDTHTISNPLLSVVSSSPVAASRKERERWLDIYDENAWIEGPAGSLPYSAADPERGLDLFYDTFIAHANISFRPLYDYVCGNTVVRDGTIGLDIAEGSPIEIPAFLRYEVTDSGKILSLRAHWRPAQAIFRVLCSRPEGLRFLAAAGKRLFEAEGLRGVGGLTRGAINTALGARLTVLRLKEYLETGRYSDAVSLFSFSGGEEIILRSDEIDAHPASYLTIGKFKLISVDKLIENRNRLSLRCDLLLAGKRRSGVAFISLAVVGFKIRTLEVFLHA